MLNHSYFRIVLSVICFTQISVLGCGSARLEAERAKAESQVNRWADKLDSQTTNTGVYIRPEKNVLPEQDPWGASLVVDYSQGGAAEILVVRSFGPDGVSHTKDDITANRSTINLKGIGEGIKQNMSEVAEETAKGTVRGLIRGAKEGVKEAFSQKDDKVPEGEK